MWRSALAGATFVAAIGVGASSALVGAELGADGQPSIAAFVTGCFVLAAVALAYLLFGRARASG